MQIDKVSEILEYSQKQGLKTKLDTNGCYPERILKLQNQLTTFPRYKSSFPQI